MKNLNVIIILIDGARLDRVQKSDYFQKLKPDFSFISNVITYAPHTIASMHATLSGCYGTRTGTNSYWSTFKFKKNHFKTLTEYFHENGYYTFCDIVNKLVIPKQGFDEFLIHDEMKDDLTLRHKAFLEQMKSKNDQDQNFFLFLQYSNIHTGIMNEVLKVYNNFSKEYFEDREKNEQRYASLFKNAEKYVSEMLQKINELGFLENSIILVMSDHGISVGEKVGERAYGVFCYDYTLRTFAYFLMPSISPIEISQQVRTVDFMPTILDYVEIPLDKNYESIDGESLMPLIKGEKIPEKIAYSEAGNPLQDTRPPKEPNTKSVRTSRWKLILNEYDGTRELYDLFNDPSENENLSGTGLEIEDILFKKLEILKAGGKLPK